MEDNERLAGEAALLRDELRGGDCRGLFAVPRPPTAFRRLRPLRSRFVGVREPAALFGLFFVLGDSRALALELGGSFLATAELPP